MYFKYLLVLFSFFVFFSQTAYAEHKATDKSAIKALITKVKTVEPSQRRVLMNELKVMLRSMHQETRTQVMLDLRRSFSAQGSSTHNTNKHKHSNMHHQTTMSMTESKHMQEHMTQCNMTTHCPTGHMSPINRPHGPKIRPQDTPMRGM